MLHGQGHSQLLSIRFRNCLSTENGTLGGPVVSAFIFMTIRNNAFQPDLITIYAAFLHSRSYEFLTCSVSAITMPVNDLLLYETPAAGTVDIIFVNM